MSDMMRQPTLDSVMDALNDVYSRKTTQTERRIAVNGLNMLVAAGTITHDEAMNIYGGTPEAVGLFRINNAILAVNNAFSGQNQLRIDAAVGAFIVLKNELLDSGLLEEMTYINITVDAFGSNVGKFITIQDKVEAKIDERRQLENDIELARLSLYEDDEQARIAAVRNLMQRLNQEGSMLSNGQIEEVLQTGLLVEERQAVGEVYFSAVAAELDVILSNEDEFSDIKVDEMYKVMAIVVGRGWVTEDRVTDILNTFEFAKQYAA